MTVASQTVTQIGAVTIPLPLCSNWNSCDFKPASGPKPPSTGFNFIITVINYSTLYKLLAVTAYVIRFVFNGHHNHSSKKGPLSAEELHDARMT